jgi:RNA polymerase sigma-70 factor (ECF subfamily)
MAEAPDRDLVQRTRGGEVDAFGEIVRRHQGSVFNVCYRLLGERRDAEDLAQETFLRAYRRLASFDEDRPFGPWVRRIAARLCLNQLVRYDPPRLPFDDEGDWPAAREGEPESVQVGREKEQALRQALLALTPRQRTAIELRHFQELSYAEIGEVMGLGLSDVKSHLYRARRALAERLKSVD